MPKLMFLCIIVPSVLLALPARLHAFDADLIVYNGKIVTVDQRFSIAEAMAVVGDRIVRIGRADDVMRLKGANTTLLDLKERMVLPGLIDSHVHPGAAMTEFDHPIPEMESIQDVLDYIRERAKVVPSGNWIQLSQVFITRLREQRYPTRAELDAAAPQHPVVFSTGPDASLNTRALQESGITRDFKITDGGPGFIEKDAQGEPTGILRSCTRIVKSKSSGKSPSAEDYYRRTMDLFKDYNSVGLTTVADRSASPDAINRYDQMRKKGDLTVRMAVSQHVATIGPLEEIQAKIRAIAQHPLRKPDPMLQIIGIKTFLDGGMLTGSAYMRKPWGVSQIYAITDPNYKGVLFIPEDRLLAIVRTTIESGLQFTAHSVGDGAVHNLLDAYAAVAKERPIKETRPCITHSNFMSREAVQQMAKLGVVVDIQPAWLYLDTRTLVKQFGYDRLSYFQPLRSIFEAGGIAGGGSDHMQKIGSLRSINPYNPFLAMWVTITRRARWHEGQLHPEQALSRQQAITYYTRNNAYLLFKENEIGSLETFKLADFIVLDRDLLTCPEDDIKNAQVLKTYMGGKLVHDRGAFN